MKQNKIKTYVLTVSRYFPVTHPRKGDNTFFPDKIGLGVGAYNKTAFIEEFGCLMPKIHTIRANYDLWKKRIDEVNEGRAVLSIRYWTGKPYNSKQEEAYTLDKDSGIGVQLLDFDHEEFAFPRVWPHGYNYISVANQTLLNTLAKNDGLSFDDFKAWFKGYDLSKPMAIIQFTDFRY
jgi:hypothetical protein